MISHPCFDDVLLEPVFSKVISRQDVDLSTEFLGLGLTLPVINSNMDTIASPALSKVLTDYGVASSIHRFCSIPDNILAFRNSTYNGFKPIVSVGVGETELERATYLVAAGAELVMLDVAHAANMAVVDMYCALKQHFPKIKFIVGNFGTASEIKEFVHQAAKRLNDLTTFHIPDAVCVGIGGGSMCLTRVVTGVGIPTLASILDCASICDDLGMKMMVNGGLRNSGDIVKALAAGADLVMLGSMFAGTDEASGQKCTEHLNITQGNITKISCGVHKEYRGSASLRSYEVQGKVASWRAPEGDSTWVSLKGPATNVLNNINGGIRSACSYLNASTIQELRANAKFNFITPNTVKENQAHGKQANIA